MNKIALTALLTGVPQLLTIPQLLEFSLTGVCVCVCVCVCVGDAGLPGFSNKTFLISTQN